VRSSNLFLPVAFVALEFFGCKQPDVTESPAKLGSAKEPSAPVVLVTGEEQVSLEETPKLTVSLDVKNCLGSSKWLDPAAGIVLRAGAISVAPRVKDADDSTQPESHVFQPDVPVDEADSTDLAKTQFSWRIKRASYSIEIIAYNVKTTTVESKINKDFDFSTGNEVNLTVEGTWQSNLCKLAWK
jgi:hypothetical protein